MSLKMRGEVLDEVVRRLRSGEYKQGQSALRRVGENDGPDTYCCLGVMCEVAVEQGVITNDGAQWRIGGTSYSYRDGKEISTSYLPNAVIEWAGMVSDMEKNPSWGEYHYEQRGSWGEDEDQCLAVMNDRGMPFPEIADWMEANVERV